MAEFHGTVELISGITPKNGGSFALVSAHDVQVDTQDNRLDTEFSNLRDNVKKISFNLIPDEYVKNDGTFDSYTGWSRTDYIECKTQASFIANSTIKELTYCYYYNENKAPIKKFTVPLGENEILTDGASYFVISGNTGSINQNKLMIHFHATDSSLSVLGNNADSKAVGEAIASLESKDNYLENGISWWAPNDVNYYALTPRKQETFKHVRDLRIYTHDDTEEFKVYYSYLSDNGELVLHIAAFKNGTQTDISSFTLSQTDTPVWVKSEQNNRVIEILYDTKNVIYPDSLLNTTTYILVNKRCILVLDDTLTKEFGIADAKTVMDAIEAGQTVIDKTLSKSDAAAEAESVGLVEQGYYVFPYTIVPDSYPAADGTFKPSSGWDRTEYIEVSQDSIFINNPTRTSSNNGMYDENHILLSSFTVAVGEKVKVRLKKGTRYVVLSNKREDFYKTIYEKSHLLTDIDASISELLEQKIEIEKLNCQIVDWSLFGSDAYQLGWRNGRYNTDDGAGDESNFYLRTLQTSSIVEMVDGAKYFKINVPNDYAVSVAAFDRNTGAFIKSWGNYDSRATDATNELVVEVVHTYKYQFTVGRFNDNNSNTKINDSALISSFVLSVYWKKNNDDILPYYFPYIQNKVDAINEIRRSSNPKTFGFVFVTDYHSIRNAKQSHKLIKYICRNTGVRDVVFGGDAFQNWRLLPQSMRETSKVYDILQDATNGRFLCVYGNHEWNDITGQENTMSGVAQMTVRNIYGQQGVDEYGDYYIDNELCKTRIFFLTTTVSAAVPWESILWLANQLNLIPAGYFAMVICHCGLLNGEQGVYKKNSYENVSKLLGAYDRHTSTTLIDGAGNERGTFNYSSSTGSAICYLSGHVHEDLQILKADDTNGVLTFTTTGDLYKNASGTIYTFVDENDNTVARNVGTIYENAFDVIHVDTTARKIYCTRIGAGVDREFTF